MTIVDNTPPRQTPVREIISLVLLLIGIILVTVGSFGLLGLFGSLLILGISLSIVAVVIGYNK
jgi:hypothetical protein